MNWFSCTKQKLTYLRLGVNILLFLGIVFAVYNNVKTITEIRKIGQYVERYSTQNYDIATHDMQTKFNDLLNDNGLTINNNNATYEEFDELEDVTIGKYKLNLSGSYLHLIDYLKLLRDNNMLHDIKLFSLAVESTNTINIRINLESLYEKN